MFAEIRHVPDMKKAAPEKIPNRIAEIRRGQRISMEALAEAIGTTASTINKLEKGEMRLSDRYIGPIADFLKVAKAELFEELPHATASGMPPRLIPNFGLAAGAIRGNLTMTTEPVEWVPAPRSIATARDAYALTVTGSSMEPRYYAGDVIFVQPNRPPRPGDHIVIQETLNGGVAVSIKRFDKMTESHLVTVQYNPLAEVKFSRAQIMAIHRVLTTNEVSGV